MQDYIRTSTYQRAMLDNTADFNDKVGLSHLPTSELTANPPVIGRCHLSASMILPAEFSSVVIHTRLYMCQNK